MLFLYWVLIYKRCPKDICKNVPSKYPFIRDALLRWKSN
jgi:hypothetical protein